MKRFWFALLILSVALPMTSCRKPKRVFTQQERQQVKDNIMTALPEAGELIPVGANFDDKIELTGYTMNRHQAQAGDTVVFTLYWKCLKSVPGEFKIFMHLDSKSRKTFDHHGVGGLYPVSSWKPGEVIRDEVVMNVDASYPTGPAQIWLGFFDDKAWRESQRNVRLPLKNANGFRTDKGDRLLVASLYFGELPARELTLRKTPGPIKVDGVLDEPAWATGFAAMAGFFTPDGKPLPAPAEVKVSSTFDDQRLYFGFQVKDTDLSSPYTDRDSTLWSGPGGASDVVEIFLDPDGDGRNYLELQVSPGNVLFDAIFASHRNPAWQEASKINLGVQSEVTVDGSLNAAGEDNGYTVEVAIPWKDLPDVAGMPTPERPFRVNFFRLSNSGHRAAAWFPAGNDFHDLSLSGTLRFAP